MSAISTNLCPEALDMLDSKCLQIQSFLALTSLHDTVTGYSTPDLTERVAAARQLADGYEAMIKEVEVKFKGLPDGEDEFPSVVPMEHFRLALQFRMYERQLWFRANGREYWRLPVERVNEPFTLLNIYWEKSIELRRGLACRLIWVLNGGRAGGGVYPNNNTRQLWWDPVDDLRGRLPTQHQWLLEQDRRPSLEYMMFVAYAGRLEYLNIFCEPALNDMLEAIGPNGKTIDLTPDSCTTPVVVEGECPICYETLNRAVVGGTEPAVKTKCNHILCKVCLSSLSIVALALLVAILLLARLS